jgi:glycosyltransferase involved in cell wall biosynthesis
MISFFGIIHQSGGCGPELLGAIGALQKLGCPVRCIVPIGDPITASDRADYLRGLGVVVTNYRPGMFEQCPVLVSFGEGKCFEYMREYSDRPKYMMWSGCMSYETDEDVAAVRDGLVDEYIFQTQLCADTVGEAVSKRAGKQIAYRKGYRPCIDLNGIYSPQFPLKGGREFRVLKAVRDDAEKWHEDTWRMFVGVCGPAEREVRFDVAGWGPEAAAKIGSPIDPTSRWAGMLNMTLHPHVYGVDEMNGLYEAAHVLLHYYPFVESFGYATVQAMLAGAVVIGADEGGFRELIRHGETGFLASSTDEAAYYTSRLAFEPELRDRIADAARDWVVDEGPGNLELALPWWREIM